MEAKLGRTKSKPKRVIENIDTATSEILNPPKIETEDPLLNVLSADAENVSKDGYFNDKVLDDKTIEQIKDEYNFDDIKDAFDDGQVLMEFLFSGENQNFACNFLSLNADNDEFIYFLYISILVC